MSEEYRYAASRERIQKTVHSTAGGATVGDKTYYAWGGSSVLAEYTETASATSMTWAKSYVYAGDSLLSTITKSGSSEVTEYHHPDGLGTKLITNTVTNTAKQQSTLPFGTLISSETQASTNQKFTSYDRSGATGLDYAVNRTYNSGQSRFTQVDPIGMGAASIGDPQSMNMFAYVGNDPIGFTDPSGLLAGVDEHGCPLILGESSHGNGGGGGSTGSGGGSGAGSDTNSRGTLGTISDAAHSVIFGAADILTRLGIFGPVPYSTASWNPNLPDALSGILSGGLNSPWVIKNFLGRCGEPGQPPCLVEPGIIYIKAIPAFAGIFSLLGKAAKVISKTRAGNKFGKYANGAAKAFWKSKFWKWFKGGYRDPKFAKQLERQLAKDGAGSVKKSLQTLQGNLKAHLAKLPNLKYKSSVEREIRTIRNQISTAKKFIKKNGIL